MYIAPGQYCIRVAGRLDACWVERLGGLRVRESRQGDEPGLELTGWLADQAALYGVLNTLYDHHCALLYVEYLGPAEEEGTQEDED
jgi:hypothetical protein